MCRSCLRKISSCIGDERGNILLKGLEEGGCGQKRDSREGGNAGGKRKGESCTRVKENGCSGYVIWR